MDPNRGTWRCTPIPWLEQNMFPIPLAEVTKSTPEDEQKRDHEEDCEGDPQPSLTLLAPCHMNNASSYNPNASHRQQDQERYVLSHRHEPGRGPHPPTARDDPCLPETDATHQCEECASTYSPARKRPIPPTRTTPNVTNNHGYRRDTSPPFCCSP